MQHRSSTIRGSLALVGVALVLIFTAGAASAEETGASQSGDQAAATASTSDPGNGAVIASSDSTDTGDSQVGDALLIERPAPSRSPGTEVTGPAAAPVDAPASAPAAPAEAAPAVSAAPATSATAAAPASSTS